MPKLASTRPAYKMLTCIYLCRTLLFFAPYADFLLEKERIEIQKRINLYMLDLENRLKAYQEVDFSAFFYEVLKKENGNIRICVKLAHKTMSKYYRDINSFGISISTEIVGIPEYPMIKIWKTIIYKKM